MPSPTIAISEKSSFINFLSMLLCTVGTLFGFKFIMGSANEKADYAKSFIPLIVGVIVVFSATSIAKLLFSLMA